MRLSEVDTTYKPQGQRLSDVMSGVTKEPEKDVRAFGSPFMHMAEIRPESKPVERLSKQFYNTTIAAPALAMGTQSTAGEAGTLAQAHRYLREDFEDRIDSGQPVTEKEVIDFTKAYRTNPKLSKILQPERFEKQKKIWEDYQSGKLNIEEESPELDQQKFTKALAAGEEAQFNQSNISLAVEEASGALDKAVDVLAGVSGFMAQLAVLRNQFPGIPEVGIWELHNQANGGTPGKGAINYLVYSIPGRAFKKVKPTTVKGKIAKAVGETAAESATLAGMTALEGGSTEEIVTSALIAPAFKVAGLVKNLKSKNPELAETVQNNQDYFSIETKGSDAVPVILNKTEWLHKWGGDSVSNLKLKMNELLFRANKIEQKYHHDSGTRERLLNNLADQMDGIHKKLVKMRNLPRKSNKTLLNLAKQRGVKIPKGASRETIIELLKGQNDIVPTRDGFMVRDIENPDNQWKPERYKTIAKAKQVLLNQEVNLAVSVEGMDAVIVANNDGGKVEVFKDKTWITSQVGGEINQLAQESGLNSEYIVGNIQLQEVGRQVRSRIVDVYTDKNGKVHRKPINVSTKEGMKRFCKKYIDSLGMGDWGIKPKPVKRIPKRFDPTGRATGYAELDNPTDLSRGKRGGTLWIKLPTGKVLTEVAWTPTPGQAGHVGRKWGEITRHTNGYAKRDVGHELTHFIEPGTLKNGRIEVHTPEFKVKANTLSDHLFNIRKTYKPVSEKYVRLSEPPKVDINVYKTESGKTGITEAELTHDKKTGKLTYKGEQVILDTDLSGSGLLSRNSVPPDYKPLKKKYKRKGKTVEVRGKSAIEAFKQWEVKEYKPAKGEWETAKAEAIKKKNAQAISLGKRLKEQGVPQEEINRMLKSAFKGKVRRPKFKAPDLTPEQWNGIAERIDQVYKGRTYDITTAQSGLDKIRNEQIPADSEMNKLRPILGDFTVDRMSEGFEKIRTHSPIAKAQFFRDMWKVKFGLDIQAARQLSGIAATHPRVYATAVKINTLAYGSQKYANKIKAQIEQNPTFRLAQERYGINMLWTKPWKKSVSTKLEQYGNVSGTLVKSKSKVLRAAGKVLQASERGANLGIDWALTRLVEQAEVNLDKLAKKNNWSQTQIDRWRLERGKDINALTKRFVAKSPKGQQIQAALNWVWLSPSWTISRPLSTYRAINNLVSGMPGNRIFAAQTVAAHLGAMVALGTLGSWLAARARLNNPNEEPTWQGTVDPTDSLFGKLRVGNEVFDFTSGDAAWYRLLARIGVSAYVKAKETITGKMVTKVAGKPVRPAGEEVKKYLQSRETIILGLGKTLLTGKDWLGRPIESEPGLLPGFPGKASLIEIAKAITPEALISIIEAGAADGMWEDMLAGNPDKAVKDLVDNWPVPIIASLGGGTTSYKVSPYSTRADFRDIIAQEDYKKGWNDLNPSQVRRLEKKYKTEFGNFESQIREWKVKNPPNIEAIKEEERESGKIVRKNLSAENQLKVRGTTLGLSRRPQNFYLNDERYNRYIELYTEKLEELLDRKDAPSQRAIDTYKTLAKNKAYSQLKKEMK